ncbi:MAG: hypothetical protein HY909_06320 [Deltaproteobacteria bacterium]|nr:hypothetical protein [Deltaproteobacteria bacterium]
MARPRCLSFLLVIATVSTAWADPPRPPLVEVSGEVGGVLLSPSSYRAALCTFGYSLVGISARAVLRGLWVRSPRLRLGGRVGYQYAVATPSPQADAEAWPLSIPAPVVGDPMNVHLLDLGVVGRVLVRRPEGDRHLRVDLEVELGAALGVLTRGDAVQRAVLPRLAVSVFFGDEGRRGALLAGLRIGVQYVPWGAAEVGVLDPAFAGITLGFELGGSR